MVVDILIKAGARLDLKDKMGKTALGVAQEGRHFKCMDLLEVASGLKIKKKKTKKKKKKQKAAP